ncbi:GntR family transcriptional regulator [Inquilinus sp. Marseille-Q2685]|uniref:GntR family transcriptional regulator n=1 Tax=Inquilinus sp. Marseille-Q2685 TaxID=2866581 RepID=UPI001CE4718A|nr:GntR family transcriptional regulator [Inquilinus sp. Marseille-Q2685]
MADDRDAARRDTCYVRLKDMAVHCRFRPGEHLKVGRLCERLKASSTPVRESLIRLHAEGLVTATSREGFFARVPETEEFSELYRLARTLLSDAMLGAAAAGGNARAEAAEIAVQSALLFSPPARTSAWAAIEQLTLGLSRLARNREVTRIIGNVNDRVRCIRMIACLDAGAVQGMVADTQQLADAIAAADAAGATRSLETMFDRDIRRLPDLTKELLARAHAGGIG